MEQSRAGRRQTEAAISICIELLDCNFQRCLTVRGSDRFSGIGKANAKQRGAGQSRSQANGGSRCGARVAATCTLFSSESAPLENLTLWKTLENRTLSDPLIVSHQNYTRPWTVASLTNCGRMATAVVFVFSFIFVFVFVCVFVEECNYCVPSLASLQLMLSCSHKLPKCHCYA